MLGSKEGCKVGGEEGFELGNVETDDESEVLDSIEGASDGEKSTRV